jgi:hypothetical protein
MHFCSEWVNFEDGQTCEDCGPLFLEIYPIFFDLYFLQPLAFRLRPFPIVLAADVRSFQTMLELNPKHFMKTHSHSDSPWHTPALWSGDRVESRHRLALTLDPGV